MTLSDPFVTVRPRVAAAPPRIEVINRAGQVLLRVEAETPWKALKRARAFVEAAIAERKARP